MQAYSFFTQCNSLFEVARETEDLRKNNIIKGLIRAEFD
jgi:hypothetical protein